jgi:hypothetical protein
LHEVSLFYHLLEGLDFEQFFDFGLNFLVLAEVWFGDDPIHEAFHDFLIFVFVEVEWRSLLQWFFTSTATFLSLQGGATIFLDQSIFDNLQSVNLFGSFL